MTSIFKKGEKVIYTPENKIYDFGYFSKAGTAVIYEQGETNMQDSFAVDLDKLKKIESDSDLICPFCKESDFDKIGLKYHLQGGCDEYDKTPKPW